jgi:Homing endonuclease associated repeat/Homeodomain-like domain
MAELTREEKIREARRLRAEGWAARKIAAFLGINESTVRNWYLGGDCSECGAPIDGGSPGVRRTDKCARCFPAACALWSRERIVERIKEWNRVHGEPPTALDWLLQVEGFPACKTVQEYFGSWNAAITAAGFTPLKPGGSRHLRTEAAA